MIHKIEIDVIHKSDSLSLNDVRKESQAIEVF